jgi:HSF-type DNA-binding
MLSMAALRPSSPAPSASQQLQYRSSLQSFSAAAAGAAALDGTSAGSCAASDGMATATSATPPSPARAAFEQQAQQQQQHSSSGRTSVGTKEQGRPREFPTRLHQMLCDLERQGREDIASFAVPGNHHQAFAIHRPEDFVRTVLPSYFPRMHSLSSFYRQLNLYKFERISADHPPAVGASGGGGAYAHPQFQRGHPELLALIRRDRKPVKKS